MQKQQNPSEISSVKGSYILVWDQAHQKSFHDVECKLSSTPVLCLYNQSNPTNVTADALSYGIGAVLLQKQEGGEWKPVAYSSRSLTSTEQKYTQ